MASGETKDGSSKGFGGATPKRPGKDSPARMAIAALRSPTETAEEVKITTGQKEEMERKATEDLKNAVRLLTEQLFNFFSDDANRSLLDTSKKVLVVKDGKRISEPLTFESGQKLVTELGALVEDSGDKDGLMGIKRTFVSLRSAIKKSKEMSPTPAESTAAASTPLGVVPEEARGEAEPETEASSVSVVVDKRSEPESEEEEDERKGKKKLADRKVDRRERSKRDADPQVAFLEPTPESIPAPEPASASVPAPDVSVTPPAEPPPSTTSELALAEPAPESEPGEEVSTAFTIKDARAAIEEAGRRFPGKAETLKKDWEAKRTSEEKILSGAYWHARLAKIADQRTPTKKEEEEFRAKALRQRKYFVTLKAKEMAKRSAKIATEPTHTPEPAPAATEPTPAPEPELPAPVEPPPANPAPEPSPAPEPPPAPAGDVLPAGTFGPEPAPTPEPTPAVETPPPPAPVPPRAEVRPPVAPAPVEARPTTPREERTVEENEAEVLEKRWDAVGARLANFRTQFFTSDDTGERVKKTFGARFSELEILYLDIPISGTGVLTDLKTAKRILAVVEGHLPALEVVVKDFKDRQTATAPDRKSVSAKIKNVFNGF